jgi:predicted MPP superfamily phosphohydrolase
MISRRRVLAGLTVPPLAAVGWSYAETRQLELDHRRISIAGWHASRQLRILHLADLHASKEVSLSHIDKAIELGLRERPDLICVTGDFISRKGDEFDAHRYVRSLSRLASAAPTYGVLGNHDGGVWSVKRFGLSDTVRVRDLLAKSRIELLHNRAERFGWGGHALQLVGVGDLWSNQVEPASAFNSVSAGEPVVLLAHNPDTKDELGSRYPWDLMLSGHTHGGQLRIPYYGAPFAPVFDHRYIEGLKPWNGRQIYITRGVGSTVPLRFNCRPQVSVLDLVGLSS